MKAASAARRPLPCSPRGTDTWNWFVFRSTPGARQERSVWHKSATLGSASMRRQVVAFVTGMREIHALVPRRGVCNPVLAGTGLARCDGGGIAPGPAPGECRRVSLRRVRPCLLRIVPITRAQLLEMPHAAFPCSQVPAPDDSRAMTGTRRRTWSGIPAQQTTPGKSRTAAVAGVKAAVTCGSARIQDHSFVSPVDC